MAWLSRVNFSAADVLSYASLNNLGNDIRAWGGDVNGGGFKLSNVILSSGISITAPTVTAVFTIVSAAAVPLVKVLDNGRMGIATGTPAAQLHVLSPIVDAAAIMAVSQPTSGSAYGVWAQSAGTGAGNVGIYCLAGGASSNAAVWIQSPVDSASNYAIYSASPAQSYFAGRVGLGDPAPASQLSVVCYAPGVSGLSCYVAPATGSNVAIQANCAGAGATTNTGLLASAAGAATNYGLRVASIPAGANNWSIFADAPAQSYFAGNMTIGPAGTASGTKLTPNLSLSTATLDTSGTPSINKLAVYNSSGFAAGFGVGSSALDILTGPGFIRFWTGTSSIDGTGAVQIVNISSGGMLIGYTTSNGAYKLQVNSQIFATSATIATSDGRYKTNVEPLKDALLLVNALNPVSFDWLAHPVHDFDLRTKQIGFVAQEVEKVLENEPYCKAIVKPNLCRYEDAEGKEVSETFYGIAEGNLIGLLCAAIQELTVKVLALEGKPR